MKVTAANWQTAHTASPASRSGQSSRQKADTAAKSRNAAGTDALDASLASPSKAGPDSKTRASSAAKEADPDSSLKMASSGPKNSVGELAAMLARSETLMDVQQVFSKAMRALADLKMGAMVSEGKDAKKYAQQIKRMEKLIKRIQKKLKHLAKEERMEEQAKKAAKKEELEKEKQIRQELEARRKKRHREEKEYALKELAQDGKTAVNETVSSMLSASSPAQDLSSLTEISGDLMSGDFSGVDLGGLDIMA